MTAFFGKKSLCHTGNGICWILVELCTGSALALLGIHILVGSLCCDFFGEGRRGGAAAGREQATNTLELSMTLVPPQENINHFSSTTIFISPEEMPHWEPGFLKIGAAHFSLSKTPSALRCREENLVTLVRGQCSARGWLWQERSLPGARAAQRLQQEADSWQWQGALSHRVPAPRDHIPTARHTEYPSQHRTAGRAKAAGGGTATQPGEGSTCSQAWHPGMVGSCSTPGHSFLQHTAAPVLLGKGISHGGEIK